MAFKLHFPCIGIFLVLLLVIFSDSKPHNNVGMYNKYFGRKVNCWKPGLTYEEFDMQFYFSSRRRINHLCTLDRPMDIKTIDFDPRRRTAVLVHGFLGNIYGNPLNAMRKSLLEWKNLNVITVDWVHSCINPLCYEQAAADTEYTAIQIRLLLKKLAENWRVERNVTLEQWGYVHFIGHSLGAHTVGHAAKLLKEKDHFEVDRVTALDPAEPCFGKVGDAPIRLSKDSAKFVDVIHTAVARTDDSAFGLLEPLGHVDFYVNGGGPQPDCDMLSNLNLFRWKRSTSVNYFKLFQFVVKGGVCDHFRSIFLFTESINQLTEKECSFEALPWKLNSQIPKNYSPKALKLACKGKCPEMGINAELHEYKQQIYHIVTKGLRPYCDIPR